ncbi:hypothetical protein [Aquabacterium lacunae]|nr:hypothetical protein [Aquabacterium lacunae]
MDTNSGLRIFHAGSECLAGYDRRKFSLPEVRKMFKSVAEIKAVGLCAAAALTLSLAGCGGGGPKTETPSALNTGGQLSASGGGGTVSSANQPAASVTVMTDPSLANILQDNVSGFTCAQGAITCVQVRSSSASAQSNVPMTFGQPFRQGDLPSGKHLVAKTSGGAIIPVQLDALASRADGSARFGVVSIQLPTLQAGGKEVVSFFVTDQAPVTPPRPVGTNYSLDLTMRLYQPQMTMLTFGNPNGWTDGTPFVVGETVELDLGGEVHSITIDAQLAGGSLTNTERLAKAFMNKINQDSTRFLAHKIGDVGAWNNLWITTRSNEGGAFTVTRRNTGGSAPITITNKVNYAAARTLTASAGNAVRTAISQDAKLHLRGPVAHEYTVVVPFKDTATNQAHPQLTARLHVRLLDGGARARTDVVIENNWAYSPSPGNYLYELTGTSNGQTVLSQPALTHYHHARWHKVVWQGQAVQAQVRHHMPYFMATRVVWNYNLKLTVPDSLLQTESTRLASATSGPMANVFLTPYFGTTGGRQEIGPYPRWTALFLVTQDDRARASMMANADAAGSVPIHYRDEVTDAPLDLDRHPTAATLFGYNSGTNNDRFPEVLDTGTIWTPDIAHQGSFAFVPYLITGDQFYLDELMFWAAWNMTAIAPGYRNYADGILNDQVRGQAWGLRALGEAARIAPDSHGLKGYFNTRLQKNITWHNQKTAYGSDVSPLGLLEKPDQRGLSGLWQNDFLSIVMSQLVDDGVTGIKPALDWISEYNVGRFTHETEGYCLYKAARDYVNVRDGSGQFYTTWRSLYQANFPETSCPAGVDPNSLPDSASAHSAIARAMLAASFNAQLSVSANSALTAEALLGYRNWTSRTPLIDGKYATEDPTWAIIPRAN